MNTPMSGMGNQNITIDNDMLKLLTNQMGVPLKNQIPHADQFNLADEYSKKLFNDLLLRSFRKEVVIWMLDKNWTKEGDCVVAVFYSDIIKNPVTTGSHMTTHETLKEDKLFDEFVIYMKELEDEKLEEVEEV